MQASDTSPTVSSLPIWQFMFAYRDSVEESKFRQHYLEGDRKQVLTITLTVLALMAAMTITDIPHLSEVSGLGFGTLLRMILFCAGAVLFFAITRWRSDQVMDIGVASFTVLVAICVVLFHFTADISAARIGTVVTLIIFVANIAYPVYSLYLLPAILMLLLGDTVVMLDSSRADFAQQRPILTVVFAFAELISIFASAHLQRTRYQAFRALSDVKTLSGMIPICSNCNKIRDDRGYYQQLEQYISAHSDAQFSHGICPACITQLYPEIKESGHE